MVPRRRLASGIHECFLKVLCLVYTEVSLNLSSAGVEDILRAQAAAQNANSGGRKRLLAELKMKIN